MTNNVDQIRMMFLGLAALGVVVIVVIWILRRRLLSPAAVERWQGSRPAPLAVDEDHKLQQWQRRMRWVAVATLFYAGMMVGFVSVLPTDAVVARAVAFLLLPAMVVGGVVLQFSARCPRCGLALGLQSSLGVPPCCERCGVRLRTTRAEKPQR